MHKIVLSALLALSFSTSLSHAQSAWTGGDDLPTGLTQRAMEGDAASLLVHESATAALLVVGSHGHGALGRLAFGSVGSKCAMHSRCPVLIVHETEPPTV